MSGLRNKSILLNPAPDDILSKLVSYSTARDLHQRTESGPALSCNWFDVAIRETRVWLPPSVFFSDKNTNSNSNLLDCRISPKQLVLCQGSWSGAAAEYGCALQKWHEQKQLSSVIQVLLGNKSNHGYLHPKRPTNF